MMVFLETDSGALQVSNDICCNEYQGGITTHPWTGILKLSVVLWTVVWGSIWARDWIYFPQTSFLGFAWHRCLIVICLILFCYYWGFYIFLLSLSFKFFSYLLLFKLSFPHPPVLRLTHLPLWYCFSIWGFCGWCTLEMTQLPMAGPQMLHIVCGAMVGWRQWALGFEIGTVPWAIFSFSDFCAH